MTKRLTKLSAIVVMTMLGVNALAEGSPIEEIVVTAQKVEESIRDVPMSITAATGEQLESRGILAVEDLSKITPGFSYQPAPYGNMTFNLRGIGNIDDSFASSPTVALYVDQAPVPYSVMGQGLAFDVERVEVLKGPQGTLFGLNSTGGAINFVANKPGQELEMGVRASVNEFSELSLSGHLGGPLTERFGARVAFLTQNGGEWQESVSRSSDELGDKDFWAARAIFDWHPADQLSFILNINGWKNENETQAPQFIRYEPNVPALAFLTQPFYAGVVPPGSDSEDADWTNTPLQNDDDYWQVALTGTYDFNDNVTLTSITSVSDYEQFAIVDVDGTPHNALTQRQRGTIESFSQELRLNGSFNENSRWMIGASYATDDVEMNALASLFGTNSFFPNLLNPANPAPINSIATLDPTEVALDNVNRQDVTTTGIFVGFDYSFTTDLTARVSVRYTDSENDYEGCLADGGNGRFGTAITELIGLPVGAGECVTADFSGLPPTTGLVEQSLDEDNVSFRVGLDWAVDDNNLLYANVTRGFKSGSFPNVPALDATQTNPSPQEELLAYELGFKSAVSDTLVVDGAVFFYDYEDKQLTGTVLTVVGPVPAAVSAPEAEVTGVEISAKWVPTDSLLLSLSGTYLDAEITSRQLNGPNGLVPGEDPFGAPIADLSGSSFPTTPELSLLGDIQYDFVVADGYQGYAGLSVTYRDEAQAQIGGNREFLIDSYTLIDARIGMVVREDFSVELWGNNITDEFYLNSIHRRIDTVSRLTGRPATFGLTVDYEF